MKQSHSCIDKRHMRIFLSSTFQDMDAEREYLVKKVFPLLKEEAARRFVYVTELDLRWGITPEESRSGKVLEICLDEIDNARPFFIGIVGNRYGWCPSAEDFLSDKTLQDKYPQIADYLQRGLSITEMEMQYAILGNADSSCNALFLLKAQEEAYEPLDEDTDAGKLYRLRTAIRQSVKIQGEACREVFEYHTLEELGEAVQCFFRQLLDRYFPISTSSVHERTLNAQRALLQQFDEGFVLLFSEIARSLSDWVASETSVNICLLTGESGCGKSVFLAHWINEHFRCDDISIISEGRHSSSLEQFLHLFAKFRNLLTGEIGCGKSAFLTHRVKECSWLNNTPIIYYMAEGGQCSSLDQLLRHFAVALAKLWGYEFSMVTVNPAEAVRTMLEERTGDTLPIVVLDGLDAMLWLEEPGIHQLLKLFDTCRMMLSFSDDYRFRMVLDEYPTRCFSLPSLSLRQQEYFITEYLAQYGKRLSTAQIALLTGGEKPMSLFRLHLVLNELRLFGSYERLDDYIRHLVSFHTDEQLMDAILNRYVKTFSREMVVKVVCSLYVTPHGLTEEELCGALGLRPLDWSAFYCAFKQHLTIANGLLNVRTIALRTLILRRYPKDFVSALYPLIAYFEQHPSVRANEMLAYLYKVTSNSDALYHLLSDYAVFDDFYNRDPKELAKYWQWLYETDSDKYSLGIYDDILHIKEVNRNKHVNHDKVHRFISEYFSEKKKLNLDYLKHAEWKRNPAGVIFSSMDGSLNVLSGWFLLGWGRLAKDTETALYRWEAAIRNYESSGCDADAAFEVYLEVATAYESLYRYREAARCYDQALNIQLCLYPDDKEKECRVKVASAWMFARVKHSGYAVYFAREAFESSREGNLQDRLSAGMAFLEILSSTEKAEYRDELLQVSAELVRLVKFNWGREGLEYARLQRTIARMHFYYDDYRQAHACWETAYRIFKDKHPKEAVPWTDAGLLGEKSHLCYKSGCYYWYQEVGVRDVAAAYYWLDFAARLKSPEPVGDGSLWQFVTEARDKEIARYEAEGLYRDVDYLCRLLFPSAHVELDENIFQQQMKDSGDFEQTPLSNAWNTYCQMSSIIGFQVQNEPLPVLIEHLGAKTTFSEVRKEIVSRWVELKNKFPELLGKRSLLNDDDISNAAEECAPNKILQSLLVGLLEICIEMEGWEIENKSRFLQKQQELLQAERNASV